MALVRLWRLATLCGWGFSLPVATSPSQASQLLPSYSPTSSTMQFLTANIILYARIALMLWVSFMLVKNPLTLTNANFSLLLGQAMRLPTVQVTASNPLFGLLAVFISTNALSDLIPILSENTAYFETYVPVRLMFNFILGAFCIFSNFGLIANNLVFTYAFLEIWLNFLIYNNLKDEKYKRVKTYLEEHGEELRRTADAQVVPL